MRLLSLFNAESKVTPKNLLIFINPMAGAQKGVRLFEKHVQPMLDIAEISYTVIHTGIKNKEWLAIQTKHRT